MVRTGYLHHIKKRKTGKAWVKRLDKFLLVVAIVGPLTTLPQIWDIFSRKIAEGVSITTWAFFALISVPWLVYGLVHKDKPIIISATLWIILDAAVTIGALMYA
ncbi:hypothetical protein KY329_03330 [Candidatus Woesearchaeota archaeon]|nr:hypothetical protein [Candidatus Woesearchaeota archaeon]